MAADLSHLSDKELFDLYNNQQDDHNDLSNLSDEELFKLAGAEKPEIRRSAGKAALRQAGRVGRSLATGVASIGDIPNLAAMGLHAAGLKKTPEFYGSPSGYVQEKIDKLTSGKLRPENKAEEYMDIITEGAAPAILTGGAGLAGHGLRSAAKHLGKKLTSKGAAANVGSSIGAKSYIDSSEDPSMLGVLASGIAGGRGASFLRNPRNATAYGLGKITGFSPEKYAQQKSLGLPMTPATVSNSSMPRYVELIGGKTPGSMGPLEKFHLAREEAIAKNLGISTSHDLEHAVSNPRKYLAKQGAEGYHERASKHYKKRGEKFESRTEQAIANKELADVSDIINKLEHERSLYVSPEVGFDTTKHGKLLETLKKSSAKSPFESLDQQGYSEANIDKLLKGNLKGIGYKDLDTLRENALQESIAAKTALGGSTPKSRAAMERHYLLSEARHKNMERIGTPVEAHNAREARKFWAKYRDKENGMSKYVEGITGTDNDAAAFSKLTGNDPNYLNVVRQGLPKNERPKLAEAIMGDAGERQGRFNVNTAHSKFTGWESPVKEELVKLYPTKSAQENFLGTMKYIGENKRVIEKLANTSNTAHSTEMINLIKKYGLATAGVATGAGVGAFLPLAVTYGASKLGAKMWTDQNFMKRMNDTIKAKTPRAQANHMDLLIKSIDSGAKQSTYQRKSDEKKKLHIMMTPSRAYQIS